MQKKKGLVVYTNKVEQADIVFVDLEDSDGVASNRAVVGFNMVVVRDGEVLADEDGTPHSFHPLIRARAFETRNINRIR